jgi:glycosyltransferase involved in cell wall biosynthesis
MLLHFPTIKSSTLSPIFFWFKFLLYRIVIKSAIYRSKKIIAVSEFTKKDILENYKKISPEKIKVTYEACEGDFLQSPYADEKILERYDIIKPYAVYVGNAYPHKNLERLVEAFGNISRRGGTLRLVLVGNDDYFYKRLKEFVKEEEIENIVFAGYVPDHDLDTVYHNAEVFAWPSLYEGFGLPPLEAMAEGVPVVSSDHPCMKEILGESAYYFNGRKKKEMAEAIEKIVADKELRKKLIENGHRQVKKYDWKKMAEQTLRIYKKVSGE